jgi:hypothetical protein
MKVTGPLDLEIQQHFVPAAAHAAILELKLRLLAGTVPALQSIALAERMVDVEAAVLEHFKADLSAEEVDLLVATRQMRNKLLHGEFDDLRRKVEQRAPVARGKVSRFKLPEHLTPETLIAAVMDRSTHEKVENLPTSGGTLWGWVLDSAKTGLFTQTSDQLLKALDVVDKLCVVSQGQ